MMAVFSFLFSLLWYYVLRCEPREKKTSKRLDHPQKTIINLMMLDRQWCWRWRRRRRRQEKNAIVLVLTCQISVQLPLHYFFFPFHCLLRNRWVRRRCHHYHFFSIQFTVTAWCLYVFVPPLLYCHRVREPHNEWYHKIFEFNKFFYCRL